MSAVTGNRQFPVSAGVFLGLGLGGFFDGSSCIRCCSGTTW